MAFYQASLFDAPPEPVLAGGSGWITGLVGGSLAVSLCVIAAALLGMLMLTGRLHVRRGLQVVLGCFVLLGSSALAGGLTDLAGNGTEAGPHVIVLPSPAATLLLAPMGDRNNPFDPYSGASLRPSVDR